LKQAENLSNDHQSNSLADLIYCADVLPAAGITVVHPYGTNIYCHPYCPTHNSLDIEKKATATRIELAVQPNLFRGGILLRSVIATIRQPEKAMGRRGINRRSALGAWRIKSRYFRTFQADS
jgi:hypothetical protein